MFSKISSRFARKDIELAQLRSSEAGFTLLEIIIVLGILGTLMAVLIGGLGSGGTQAKKKETAVKVNNVQASLLKYQAELGRFPSTAEGLEALLNNPGAGAKWSGPYIGAEDDIKDAWGNKFEYELTAKGSKFVSWGPDSQSGTEDDLTFVNGREVDAAANAGGANATGGQAPAQ
ncbi:prepilin-type N-terminal cleavage/methylation domain-containing protein [bacterium]|nr:prepilin-type N-terminal cleavage/methylation domain-containing protein [bacterium]